AADMSPEEVTIDAEQIDKAAALLANAKKPLLFVGSGAVNAAAEVLAIAEMLEAPVVSFTGGKGIVSDRHYLAQPALAGHELWRDTDVVLAIGTRLHQPQGRWGGGRGPKVIPLRHEPIQITPSTKPSIRLAGAAQTGT